MPATRMFGLSRILKGTKALFFGPVDLRRRATLEITRILLDLTGGRYVGDDFKLWRKDGSFSEKFKQLSPHNYFSMERKYVLREFTRSLRRHPGAIAECGCYVGVSAWFMANEADGADIYLFDSFEGLSAPTKKDTSPAGMQQWRAGDMSSSEALIRRNLDGFKNIHIMKGWIPNRFQEVADLKFKLVHIDVDLYDPTLASLQFFYPRLNQGGMIVMDDYGFENCPGAHKAAEEFMQDKPETIIHLPTGQGLIIRACPDQVAAAC